MNLNILNNKSIATLIGLISFIFTGYGQMAKVVTDLPKTPWSGVMMESELSNKQKIDMLSLLPAGDSVQFEFPDYDATQYPDGPRYFPLDTAGLHYLDLDFDGDLDLLYSGASGWLSLMDTKVFINENNKYELLKVLNGRLLDIRKAENSLEIYTLWIPCCDSYTSRIARNDFSSTEKAVFNESISVIALDSLRGMPNFNTQRRGYIEDASLFASQSDFQGIHPYFRDKNNIILDSLKSGQPISLIHIKSRTSVNILTEKTIIGKKWYLVITTPIEAPPSLYEWSDGRNRRFVGWVDKVNFNQ